MKPGAESDSVSRSASRWGMAVALAALLGPAAVLSSSPDRGTVAQNAFDVATVEELALFYAEESVRRLRVPLAYRLLSLATDDKIDKRKMIEEIRADPPRADDRGVVYPFGDKNDLSFVHHADTGTLSCWERIVKKRGQVGFVGLTGPELAAALNAKSSERERGGAEFAYDPIRDAFSLRRSYSRPPADRERFYQEIDRLIAARMKWAKGRYLKEVRAIAESRHPPGSASAGAEGFAATLVLRHFSAEAADHKRWVARYVRSWDRPPGVRPPYLVSDRELLVDQTMSAYVHFQGARNGPDGTAAVDATFRLIGPDGKATLEDLQVPIWRAEAQPEDHLQLGINDLSFSMDAAETPGAYRLQAEVCDVATGRCVRLAHPFALRSR